ncbi:MAG: myo-inosose-2 dehydratase [Bacteroidetes bacterium]|nr:MAG: myo-inosose-2 dehydratase [Bacteroidota bacterium]
MKTSHIQLGIAPIGWTNDDLPELGGQIPFEQCISEMALAGYTGCEVGNKFPRDPQVLKHFLELRGLRVCNQWFSYELTTRPIKENLQRFERQLDFLQAVGATIIGGGETGNSCQGKPLPLFEHKGMLDSASAWNTFCQGLNALGEVAAARGFKLAFHHHLGSCIQSLEETLRMLDQTDERYVWLNYDCGHFFAAGEDPVEALRQVIGRTAHVHLKDVRQPVLKRIHQQRLSFLQGVKAGLFTVPGDPEGCIDFPAIFDLLRQASYQGWIVVEAEQDPAKANPFEYALMARNYIRELTGW